MKKIQTVIVEDIKANREALKKLLADVCPQVEVVGEAAGLESAEAIIAQHNPQLVFLDIEIKKATSFELLEKLHKQQRINFEIIFFTANGTYEYATRAIEFSALDFLSKPVDSEKLKIAVDKATKKIGTTQSKEQITLLLETLQKPASQRNRIAFHLTRGVLEFVCVNDVVYLEADGTITYIHLADGSKLTAMKNLGHYGKLLTQEFSYFPISNSTIVNTEFVKRYNHAELTVHLTNGTYIYASRRGGQDFKKYLNDNSNRLENLQGDTLLDFFKKLF